MYEDSSSRLRQIIWIVLWAVVVLAVVWVLIWLFFLRGNDHKSTSTHKPSQSQAQTQQPKAQPKQNGGTAGPNQKQPAGPAAPSPSQTSPQPSAPAPNNSGTNGGTKLANTGPGDVFAVAAGVAVVGSGAYYYRLRKRLQA